MHKAGITQETTVYKQKKKGLRSIIYKSKNFLKSRRKMGKGF